MSSSIYTIFPFAKSIYAFSALRDALVQPGLSRSIGKLTYTIPEAALQKVHHFSLEQLTHLQALAKQAEKEPSLSTSDKLNRIAIPATLALDSALTGFLHPSIEIPCTLAYVVSTCAALKLYHNLSSLQKKASSIASTLQEEIRRRTLP